MIVCKFGGSSISNSENIIKVKDILLEKILENNILVVFSAIGKTTNKLLESGKLAQAQDIKYFDILQNIIDDHNKIISDLIPNFKDYIEENIEPIYKKIQDICLGIYYLKEMTNKNYDYLLSNGEILSSLIIYKYLKHTFNSYDIKYFNSFDYIVTDSNFSKANVNFLLTEKNINTICDETFYLAICTGFISKNQNNEITTLGRGGGDYSAALYGAFTNSEYVEIWTDVNGIMTSDPRIIKNAKTINNITFDEMMELSHYGANVIYAPTITPLYKKNISLYVKNTFNPKFKGTLISSEIIKNNSLATAISSIENICLIKIYGNYLIGKIGFSGKLFGLLSNNNINIIMISQSSCEHSIYIVINKYDCCKTKKLLNDSYINNIQSKEVLIEFNDKSILSIETNKSKNIVKLMSLIYNILDQNEVDVYTQTTSDHNICLVLDKETLNKIHIILHDKIFI